ncbi:MAG: cyclase family protein, partial [Gaiellaceae bacterium]
MEIFDVSVPIRTGMVTYPGDPQVSLERVVSISDGSPANLSRLDFGVHSGTHVDAPLH